MLARLSEMRPLLALLFLVLLIVTLSKTASVDHDEVNHQIESLLKDNGKPAANADWPVTTATINEDAVKAVKEEKKMPKISVSGIDDDGKRTDAVLKNDTDTDSEVKPKEKEDQSVEDVVVIPNNKTESPEEVFLPAEGAAELEHSSSLAIFFVLFVLVLCIFLIHFILQSKCHYIPESMAIVFLGAFVGAVIKLLPTEDLKKVESFSPTAFFLVLLPPIIFESGYNLHKGNFFANIGSILLFAIIGTTISALVVGGGVYLMGLADLVYPLNFVESFAFGSLISAVDPVATLAIFQALDIDPVLNMLVFGESILNDAVAIVLTATVVESSKPEMAMMSNSEQILHGIHRFLVTFLGSAGIGTVIGLVSSLVLKHVDLYYNPSLEFALMLCFVYIPYAFAEGIHLSGIMAILFCGIVMSQYTHYNLSPGTYTVFHEHPPALTAASKQVFYLPPLADVRETPFTQITMQQTMRTLAFACESCVFAYLGLAIFSFPHQFELALIIWSILFILLGRALNIFPLAYVCNRFRAHQITKKMMVIMWFSGLRGAIAYALSLHLEFKEETRKVLVTTTLVVVLFTTIILGGGTMPLMKYLERKKRRTSSRSRRRGRKKEISMSKTKELGTTLESEHLSEITEEELESTSTFNIGNKRMHGFLYWDLKYFRPFFTRRFTQRELKEGKSHITELTEKWFKDINRGSPLLLSESEEELNQVQGS